ncbi:uncharacterized protein LAESUDRAFT_765007 [Laetiporus sulphureus 93-53]|uniref:Uncharacterized protein n=1 Tax=Laetiporus sulphureus 93-53 TaxID=1314785 RepID=A0A165B0Q3_9APHY|nr:uncharacterized protein LAESUDRAFT_765007 [Laetiporus sulphureus 93-53]KZT00009.1 hypothetical protein LAESUDRAFT_765007 [Laetiporus sulphureus 93-53]
MAEIAQSEHSVEGHLNPEGPVPRASTPSSFNNTNILAPTPRYFMTPAMLEVLPRRRGPSARLVEEFATLYPDELRTGRRFHQWECGGETRRSGKETGLRLVQPRFRNSTRSYYLARPGLPPPTEETPRFWTQPVDMHRAYTHLQNDYNHLHSRLDAARREVTEAREGRLAAKATRDRLMRQVKEYEAARTERGNQIHKLTMELEAFKKALKSSEERVKAIRRLPPPSPIRSPKKPVDKGKRRQDPGQQDIRDWVKGVGGTAGPSGLKPAHQANPEQPPSRVQTPPMSPAHSYEGDQDDELVGAHYAFPPEQPVPPPDRDRCSAAPPPASSDEVHRKSFRGPKVNLPEPFDGTKARQRHGLSM